MRNGERVATARRLKSTSFTVSVFSEMYKEQTETRKNCVAKSRVRSIPLRTRPHVEELPTNSKETEEK